MGLALNVLAIWAVSVLSDLAVLSSPDRMPIASLLSVGFLFVLIPVIITRLAPSQRSFSETIGSWSSDSVDILERVALPDVVATLTDAEKEVCRLVLTGKTNREIAESLFISINTVKYHVWKSDCGSRKIMIAKLLPGGIHNTTILPPDSLD